MTDKVHTRKGGLIIYPDGTQKNFAHGSCKGINKAKKESFRIQMNGKGLGHGDVKVVR